MRKIRLKNSLSNQVENITLNEQKILNIYLCGPTVYSDVHIGNIRPSIVFDVLVRTLRELNIKVNYLQNITDIDDKIIAQAKEKKVSEIEIANFFTNSFLNSFEKLELIKPNFQTVTNNLSQILKFIEKLDEKRSIYQNEEGVFFEINRYWTHYGKLSNQNLEKLSKELGRGVNLQKKIDERDFAVWKKSEQGINWKSKWMNGRPGWHTECVALIDKFFEGDSIDIHGGGKDLLFPHHENERIQFFAVNKKELSNCWIHLGHVNSNGEKMSKSIGNYVKLEKFIEEEGVNCLKFLFLNTDYNEDINITKETLEQARRQQEKLEKVIRRIKLKCYLRNERVDKIISEHDDQEQREKALSFLLEDLQTNKVISLLENLINEVNAKIEEEQEWSDGSIQKKISSVFLISELVGVLTNKQEYNEEEKELIRQWAKYSNEKDFKNSDRIREMLKERKITP